MALAAVTYPPATEPLTTGNPKLVGAKAAENATTAQVKAAEQSGSNTYVFTATQTFVLPVANGDTRLLHVYANAPIILSAADQAALTKVGVTLPSPS